MTKQMVPGVQQMAKYIDQGLTQQEIADAWCEQTSVRVSRSAIGMALIRYGQKTMWPPGRRWSATPPANSVGVSGPGRIVDGPSKEAAPAGASTPNEGLAHQPA